MKLEDLTQERLDQITKDIEEGKEAKKKLGDLEKEKNGLEEDIKLVSASGIDPEKQQGAQRRLLQRSGLYSDQQIDQIMKQAQEQVQGGDGGGETEGGPSEEELDRLLQGLESDSGNGEDAKMREELNQMRSEMTNKEKRDLAEYLGQRLGEKFPDKYKNLVKEVAEERGRSYTDPDPKSIDVWQQQARAQASRELGRMMQANGGRLPSKGQIDSVLEEVIPKHLEQIRSVIADPSLGPTETVSGSVQDQEFDIPDEPVESPKVLDIAQGNLSHEDAMRQADAARIDTLTRAASEASQKGDGKSSVI